MYQDIEVKDTGLSGLTLSLPKAKNIPRDGEFHTLKSLHMDYKVFWEMYKDPFSTITDWVNKGWLQVNVKKTANFTLVTGPMFSGKEEFSVSLMENPHDVFYTEFSGKPNLGNGHTYYEIKNPYEILVHQNSNYVYLASIHLLDSAILDVVLNRLNQLGIHVLATGLSVDFQGNTFPQRLSFDNFGCKVYTRQSICYVCKSPADFTKKEGDDYYPVCEEHFLKELLTVKN